jgi:threonine dehydrogenase-like Zn-dependent dehydrogenase
MIGLALVQALRAAGCRRVISVDVAPDRLALAAKMGATHTVNSAEPEAAASLTRLTDGRGADLAFEAVGVSDTVALALTSLRKGGSLVLVGNVAPSINFPLQAAVTREISLFGSCASRGEYPAVLDLMARGALRPEPLISAVAPLADGPKWFDRLYNKEPGLLKVLLTP